MATKCSCPSHDCKTTIFYIGFPNESHVCSICEITCPEPLLDIRERENDNNIGELFNS